MKFHLFSQVDKNTKIAIVAGILCCACVILYMLLSRIEAQNFEKEIAEKYGVEQVEVVVAKRDLAGGETLSEADVEIKNRAAADLPEGAVKSKSEVVGKQLGSSILKGETLSTSRFQSGAGALKVPADYDAVSIPLDDTSSVGGSLKTGQRIDIYATGTSTTEKICSNVEILETSQAAYESESETKWITVAIKKDKTQEVVAASQKLELYVALPGTAAEKSE